MGKQSEHSHVREIWAVVLVGLSLLLLLSLLSYNPQDWPNTVSTGSPPVTNLIGPVGASLSWAVFMSFGFAGYALILVCAGLGVVLLLGQEVPWRSKVGAGLLLVISACCLLHLLGLEAARQKWSLVSAGGFAGLFVGGFFQKLVGSPGTAIVFGMLYVISLIVLINLRPSYWVMLGAGVAQDFWKQMRGTSKPDVREELSEQKRDLRVKELELKRELARKENEARKLEKEQPKELPTTPPPEPKYADYTLPRPTTAPAVAGEKKPSVVEKIAEKLSAKKPAEVPAAPVETVPAAVPAPEPVAPPKPKRPKMPEPEPGVLGTISAGVGEQYVLPPLELLERPPDVAQRTAMEDLKASAKILRDTVLEFDLQVESGDVTKGPTVTLFELHPAPGVKVEKITSLSNNIAMAMRAEKVRILAPVPGRGTVGVEVPNSSRTPVYLRDMLESEEWRNCKAAIPIALGRDVKGHPIIGDLASMPHMLIAGATGSGKTVCVNAILASLLFRFTAENLRLVLVDPKMVEMQHYNALPHLIVPVVTESKKVPLALGWVMREMEKRFQIFAKSGVRNISAFNSRTKPSPKPKAEATAPADGDAAKPNGVAAQTELKIEVPRDSDLIIPDKLPFIVVVVDELADLMQTVGKEVELAIARLTALGRAAGVHLIVATQRPSVNVVTGVIKANIPARVAFQVSSMQDSRVILDSQGAEKLLGKGDMLYEPGSGKAVRAQGVLVLDKEINDIVEFIGKAAKPHFEPELTKKLTRPASMPEEEADEEDEELVEQCIEVIRQTNRASVSILQRRLRIGYTRAARIMDLLEERGVVGPGKGAEPRDILIDLEQESEPNGEQ